MVVSHVLGVDWSQVFLPGTPAIEIIVRGTVMYLALFILLRVILKREAGTMGITDLLVVVLLADAAQNGMAGDYKSLPDGLLLVATIVFWSYALDWLGYRWPFLRGFIVPSPLVLVHNGHPLPQNMRKELITQEELLSQLRLQGVEKLEDVEKAFMEPDGRISVIKRGGGNENGARERRGT